MISANSAVEQFVAPLKEDERRTAVAVRQVLVDHLPDGYEEVFQKGMLCYQVPTERYGKLPQKQPLIYMAMSKRKAGFTLHMMTAERRGRAWLEDEFRRAGKKLDLGRACLHFREVNDLPLDVVGAIVEASTVDDYVAWFETSRNSAE